MCAGRRWPQAMAVAALLLATTCSLVQAETFQGGWVPLTAPCPTCRNSRDVGRDAARPQTTGAAQFHHPPPPLPSAPAAAFVNQQVQQHFLQQRPDIQQLIGHSDNQQSSALLPQQILAPPTAQGFLQPSALNLAALLQLQQQQLQQQQLQQLQLQQQLQQPVLTPPLDTPPLRSASPAVQQSSTPQTSQNVTDSEEVQLLYVPVETLRQRGRLQAEQTERPHQEKREEQQGQHHQQAPLVSRLRSEQSTRAQQKQQTTTSKPAPHTPPLSVFMDNEGRAVRIADVVRVLKAAKIVDVLDTVGPDSPQIFVGPSNLETPKGYTKFELPYLSSIESNRVERKVDKLPFFVAPLSFKPPQGYSKIPFPPPHVGSVVVSSDVSALTEKNSIQEKPTESSSTNARGKQQNTYRIPPDLPPINPQLPSLVNSLEDPAQRGQNVLLVPQDDQFSTSRPPQLSTRPTYIFKQSQRNAFRPQETIQAQQKSPILHISSTEQPQQTLMVQPKPHQSHTDTAQEGERQVPSTSPAIPLLQFPPQIVQQQPTSNLLQGRFVNQFATHKSVTHSRIPDTQRTGDRTSQTVRQFQRGRLQHNQLTEHEIVSELPSAVVQAPIQNGQSQTVSGHFQRGQLHQTQFLNQPTHISDEVPKRQTHGQKFQNQHAVDQQQPNRFEQYILTSQKENTGSDLPSAPAQDEEFRTTLNQSQRNRFNQNQYVNENSQTQADSTTATPYVQNQQDETYLTTTEKFQRGRLHHHRLTGQTTERTQIVEHSSKILTQLPDPSAATQTLTVNVPTPNPTNGQQGTSQDIDSTKFQAYLDQLISNPQISGPLSQSQDALQKLRELIAQNPQLLSPQNENTKTTEVDFNQQNIHTKQTGATAGFPQSSTVEPILPEQQSGYTTTTISNTFGSFRRQPSRGRQRITTSTYAPAQVTTSAPRRSYPRNRRPAQTRTRIQEPTTTTTTTTTETAVSKLILESQAPIENYPQAYFTQSQEHTPSANFGSASSVESYQKQPGVELLIENPQYEEQTEAPLTISQSVRSRQNYYNQQIQQSQTPKQDYDTITTTYKPSSYESLEKGSSQRNHRFRSRQRTQQITQLPQLQEGDTSADNSPSFSAQQTYEQHTGLNAQLYQTQQATTEKDTILQQNAQLQPLTPVISTAVSHTLTLPVQELQQQLQTLQQSHNVNTGSQFLFQPEQYEQANTQKTSSLIQPIAEQLYQNTEVPTVLSPQQAVTTFQPPELNPVTSKSSEYVPSTHTPEDILPVQRNSPRYTNIHRNRQRTQPNVVYQESFVQNQVQNEKKDDDKPEERIQNNFGGYRFGATNHQITTTPRTTEETPRTIHAKLRGRTRTRQRVQASDLSSRKNPHLGSNIQESTQEEEAYGFIHATAKPSSLENFSEESTEQISILQKIQNTVPQNVVNSGYEAGDYSTQLTTSSTETPTHHLVRAGLRKKIRGSARRQSTTLAPAPTTTTENTQKVYTVRTTRRPHVRTKLANTKGRIRRPTPPTTTPSTVTTLQPTLQVTAPDWEQRRPAAHRLPYAGSNEVITQTARSTLQKYTVKHPHNQQAWNQNPTEASLSTANDFHINFRDNVNQPSPSQWTPPQDDEFFINFGQSPQNVPYDQIGVGSQQQSSYNEEQKGAESQRHSTIYMMPYSSEEIRKTYELPYSSLATTPLPSIQDITTLYEEDNRKGHLITELSTQQPVEEITEAESKYNTSKKTADSHSTTGKKSIHGRRRGTWVRVRVTPSHQDILETAESQNLATVSFNVISSPLPKATKSNNKHYEDVGNSSEVYDSYTPNVLQISSEEVTTTYPGATMPPTEITTTETTDVSGSATTTQIYHNHKSENDYSSDSEKGAVDQNTNSFRDFWDMTTYVDSFLPTFKDYADDTAKEISNLDIANNTKLPSELSEKEEYNSTKPGDSTEIYITNNEQNIYEEERQNSNVPTTTEAFVHAQDSDVSNETSTDKNYLPVIEFKSNNTWYNITPLGNDYKSMEFVKHPEKSHFRENNATLHLVQNESNLTMNEEKLASIKFNHKSHVQHRLNYPDEIRNSVINTKDEFLANKTYTQAKPSTTGTGRYFKASESKESSLSRPNLIATSDTEHYRFNNGYNNTGIKKLHTPSVLKKNKQKPSTQYTSQIYDTIQDIISKAEKYDSNESTEPQLNIEIQKMNPKTSIIPPMMEQLRILGTSTSTEVSHETEICYRGRCVKTKTKAGDQVPVD